MKIDLHLHTSASDGTDSPEALVSLAARNGYSVIAVTDHDTMSGVAPAIEAGRRLGVRVIPGVEISAGGDSEVHILGYGMLDSALLEERFREMQRLRVARMREMVEKLNRLGIDIHLDQVMDSAKQSVGRSHLARLMVEEGYVRDIREAFARYLSPGRSAYVRRDKLSVPDAIRLIRSARGLPVIAHPGQNKGDAQWPSDRVRALKQIGLVGMEAYHMAHSQQQCEYYDSLARRNGLLVTGGSDYHGSVKTVAIGDGMQFWTKREEDFEAFDARVKALAEEK